MELNFSNWLQAYEETLFPIEFDRCFVLNVQLSDLGIPTFFILKFRPCCRRLGCIFVLRFLGRLGAVGC